MHWSHLLAVTGLSGRAAPVLHREALRCLRTRLAGDRSDAQRSPLISSNQTAIHWLRERHDRLSKGGKSEHVEEALAIS